MSATPQTSYTLWVIFANLYYVIAMVIFYSNRHLSSVTVRLPRFVGLCSFFGQVLFNLYLSYYYDFIFYGTPGFVHLWIQYIFIPGWMYCNLLRDLYLFFLHFLNESRMAASSAKGGYAVSKMETSERIMLKMALNLQKLVKQTVSLKTMKFSQIASKSHASIKSASVKASQPSIKASHGTISQDGKEPVATPQALIPIGEDEAPQQDAHIMSRAESQKSNRQMDISSLSAFNLQDLVKLVIIIVLFGVSLSIIFTFVFPGFNSVYIVPTDQQMANMRLPLYAIIALYFIFKCFFIYNYRHINDIYGLRIEAYATFAVMTIGYIFIVGGVGNLPSYMVMTAILTILHTLMNVFPVIYGYYDRSIINAAKTPKSDGPVSSQTAAPVQDTSAQDAEKLKLVLKNSEILYPFKQVCSQAYCLESIIFIEQMDELKSMNIKITADAPLNPTLKRKLEKIVNTFIVYGSSYEVKIDEALRQNLIVMYGKNNTKFLEDLEKAYEEIFQSLVKEVFPRFKMMHPELVPNLAPQSGRGK